MTISWKKSHGNIQTYTEVCLDCGYNTYEPWLRGCPGHRLSKEEEDEAKAEYEKESWHSYAYESALKELVKLEQSVINKQAEIEKKNSLYGEPVVRDIIKIKPNSA